MAQYQVTWNATTRVATVQLNSKAASAGSVKIGEFAHHNDATDPLETEVNHVFYHHVRDALYFQNVLDMQSVQINLDETTGGNIPATSVSITPNAANMVVGGTRQLAPVVAPADATNKAVTYTSYDATIATVTAGGLVTALKAGVCGIQIMTTDGGFTAVFTATIAA